MDNNLASLRVWWMKAEHILSGFGSKTTPSLSMSNFQTNSLGKVRDVQTLNTADG